MQKHVKNYLEYFSLDQDQVECEICGEKAVDIHHIKQRSHFGKKTKHLQDDIINIIALCRHDHQRSHFQIEPYLSKIELQDIHNQNLHD